MRQDQNQGRNPGPGVQLFRHFAVGAADDGNVAVATRPLELDRPGADVLHVKPRQDQFVPAAGTALGQKLDGRAQAVVRLAPGQRHRTCICFKFEVIDGAGACRCSADGDGTWGGPPPVVSGHIFRIVRVEAKCTC